MAAGCGTKDKETSPQLPQAAIASVATDDGITLSAAFYSAPLPDAPGLILVHGYGEDKHVYQAVIPKLRDAGYVLGVFDLRGHGKDNSISEGVGNFPDFETTHWMKAAGDFHRIIEELIEHKATKEKIAIIGSDIGGMLALRYALIDSSIAALVLLSPSLKVKDIDNSGLISRLRSRPVLLITAEQDAYAASSARALHAEAPEFCELRIYPGSAHGAELLEQTPGAMEDMLLWLDKQFRRAVEVAD